MDHRRPYAAVGSIVQDDTSPICGYTVATAAVLCKSSRKSSRLRGSCSPFLAPCHPCPLRLITFLAPLLRRFSSFLARRSPGAHPRPAIECWPNKIPTSRRFDQCLRAGRRSATGPSPGIKSFIQVRVFSFYFFFVSFSSHASHASAKPCAI